MTFGRNPHIGVTEKYQTFWPQKNLKNPNPWEKGIRYDGPYHPHEHFNKSIKKRIDTPHIHDTTTPGGVRPPFEWEIPQ